MTTFDFAILIRASGLDVPMANAPALDREEKSERKLRAVVGLQLADGERERRDDLVQEVEAGEGVLAPIETQDPEAGAVIARRVLVGLRAADLHDLDIHLNRLSGRRLLEELQLAAGAAPLWPLDGR